MRKIFAKFVAFLLVMVLCHNAYDKHKKASDSYVRSTVVLLKSPSGSCTGVQVEGAKGGVYVLTAAHCRPLLIDDKVLAVNEDGAETVLSFVAEDPTSDLMLLTGSAIFGHVAIAKDLGFHEHVHAMTHGHGAPTYRTDGEILDRFTVSFLAFEILAEKDIDACLAKPKNEIKVDFMSGRVYCVATMSEQRTTAGAIPGSSGGPLLNDSGELVGIVSCGNPDLPIFNFYVTLSDIQKFLAAKAI